LSDELLTELRYKSEGTDIDFKQTQYRFIGGSDEEKSEMLKDILAISNAWRDGPGYILVGFKDQRPHPAEVVGIIESIDDAKLQQFVSSKVKPKLTFHYEECLYEGKTVGVFTIPKQKRPFFLANPFGKLKKNIVYVRRGSSTDEAEPSEITQMGLADAGRGEIKIDLSVLTPDNIDLPTTFDLNYLKFSETFPDYESTPKSSGRYGLDIGPPMQYDNRDFFREYAEYARVEEGAILMKFALLNRSEVQLSNAKLEISGEPLDEQSFQMLAGEDRPSRPEPYWDALRGVRSLPEILARRNPTFLIDENGVAPTCHVRFGNLLPGEEGRSSDTLAIIPQRPGKLRLRFRILASELTVPKESELVLQPAGKVWDLDFDGFKDFMRERLTREKSEI
jgi:hypothetical protein